MLVVVLLLVLAAGGALVSAVVVGHPQWAWLSVLLSVLGAVLLVSRRHRRHNAAEAMSESGESAEQPDEHARGIDEPANAGARTSGNEPAEAKDGGTRSFSALAGGAAGAGGGVTQTRTGVLDAGSASSFFDEEPGDEGTDPTVLLQGSELDVQVVVIDERPRYHLARCQWLGNRTTIPLALREARHLGFTPCALCAPNAVLTRKARANRRGPNPS